MVDDQAACRSGGGDPRGGDPAFDWFMAALLAALLVLAFLRRF